ncbi:aminotransferase class I/II-fold pyridoxal phosphate-dependent enzyme [Catellatospora citrea]|uniref:DegT/DnrJ/EryC1/StrS family aminotransferase n=1 Tax=Catellatospora citrea TaxID=53366 RepID=UPI00340104DA
MSLTPASGFGQVVSSMPDPAMTRQVDALEQALALRFGARQAIAVSSGTAALHAALFALGTGVGDEVLVPALSVAMSVAPVTYTGATPIFVECNDAGDDFDYDDLAAKATPRSKVIMPVHMWGRAGDPGRLRAFADHRAMAIVEDACQAHGTTVDGRQAGTFGDLGCFSLKDGKILWSGEGGFILTDNAEYAAICRAFRGHWLTPPVGQLPQSKIGHNYRLAEPLAAIALANLRRFDELRNLRIRQTTRLLADLTGTPGLSPYPTAGGWNGYAPMWRVDLLDPRAFCQRLATLGVPNSVGTFGLMSCDLRPGFDRYVSMPCRHTAALIDRTLALVVTERTTDAQLSQYADIIDTEARRWLNG